jgi:2',3'-cyclic-nucleotide 2'-phosphodiesterase
MTELSERTIGILFIADVVGQGGIAHLHATLPGLRREHAADFVVANGENAAAGRGLTPSTAQALFDCGVDVITGGNHTWNKDKIFPVLEESPHLLRPLNYPAGCPGRGTAVVDLGSRPVRIAVVNLQGRSFMSPIDCPFRAADAEVERLQAEGIRIIFIDFHAEATAEKIALGRHLDGRISAVIGTHTHVMTADERILPGGTAYLTDAGMTGPADSVIGMDTETAVLRFMSQLPVPYRVSETPSALNGVVVVISEETGKARSIRRITA